MTTMSLEELRRTEDPKWVRELITPEGVPLRFTLARGGERAGAFAIDLFIQALIMTIVSAGLEAASGGQDGSWLTAFVTVLSFLFMNFYFVMFEVRWQGATPGKRKIGIRVIDARGGQLETSAILARNLIRELELWTPARFLIARQLFWPGAPTWATVLAVAWAVVFMFMPMFNKDRLRIGDMIAGTRVVLQPKVVLAPDLISTTAVHVFTDKQLTHYGIYELQVLEGVLRTDPTSLTHLTALDTVADKVRAKIRYELPVRDNSRFLHDFYAAQRAHLEKKLVLGQRREDKYAK